MANVRDCTLLLVLNTNNRTTLRILSLAGEAMAVTFVTAMPHAHRILGNLACRLDWHNPNAKSLP